MSDYMPIGCNHNTSYCLFYSSIPDEEIPAEILQNSNDAYTSLLPMNRVSLTLNITHLGTLDYMNGNFDCGFW